MKKEFPIKSKKTAAPKKGSKEAQLKMQFVRAAKKQTGTSNIEADKKRQAMAPGKRKSQYGGGTYYEYRANRSDQGVLLGVDDNNLDLLKKDILQDLAYSTKQILIYESILKIAKAGIQLNKDPKNKLKLQKQLKVINEYLIEMKEHIKQLKKLI